MPKQKRLVTVSDMHLRENNMEPIYTRYEYNPKTRKTDYSVNGKETSEKEFNKVQPQDIDLRIEQGAGVVALSTSSRNSFELVDFVADSNGPLTIIIHRKSNSGYGDVSLCYIMYGMAF